MIIGVLTVSFHIPLSNSLKEKRRCLLAVKAKLATAFNVSVAEVGEQEKWQRSVVAVVHVGVTKPVVNSVLSNIVTSMERMNHLCVLDYEMEMIG